MCIQNYNEWPEYHAAYKDATIDTFSLYICRTPLAADVFGRTFHNIKIAAPFPSALRPNHKNMVRAVTACSDFACTPKREDCM